MARLKNICSRGLALLFLRPASGLKLQARRTFVALRWSAQKLSKSVSKVWRLSNARVSLGLDQLLQLRAPHPAEATLGPQRPTHLRGFVKRFHFLGAEPKRWRAWAIDARGYWVMHQEAGGWKREAEETKEVEVPSTIEKEHETLVEAAEKDLRKIQRLQRKQVEAAARRLEKAQKHKARRLYQGNSVLLFEDRIETLQGIARFAEGPVQAMVHFPASALEPQVIVDTPDFVSVIPCKPGKAGKLTERINQAAWIAPEIAAASALAISAARLQLETTEMERDEHIKAAESRLETARGSFDPLERESSH